MNRELPAPVPRKSLWSVLRMWPMSAIPPRPPAARAVRAATAGAALVCAVGLTIAPIAGAVPLGAGTPAAAPGATDPKKLKAQVDKEIDQLREHLHDTSADLSNAYIALRRTQAALPGAQAALDQATAALAKADAHNDEMAVRLQVAQANEARAVDELAQTRATIKDTRSRVARFASQLYQDQGMGQLTVALNATSPDDFASRMAMTDTVMSVQHQSLDRLATEQAAATAQEAHVKALRVEVAKAKVAAEKALARATAARGAAASAKQRLDQLAAQQTAQSRTLEARKAAELRELKAAQKEQARLQAVLVARAKAAKAAAERARKAREAAARAAAARAKKRYVPPPEPRADGFLSAPSSGWVSSEFGMRYHPIYNYWRLHAGRDYAADCGTPVRAAAPGTVISTGWGGGYGNRVILEHGVVRGVYLSTTYNHLSGYAVQGGRVARGQVIGYVGTTGSSTGCHLHFETYEDGRPRDPRRWM